MRKAVDIAKRSRRGIPLHWNERYQDKRETGTGLLTTIRRLFNRLARARAKHSLRGFYGDWEEFDIPKVKGGMRSFDWS
jgi:hypothetical protein